MKTKNFLILSLLAITTGIIHANPDERPKMNGKLRVTTLSPEEIRYTGKPYIKELGAYAFNCRNYDPETARWTTPDPSGFPDGANNRIYAPVPTCGIDAFGLNWVSLGAPTLPSSEDWNTIGNFRWHIVYTGWSTQGGDTYDQNQNASYHWQQTITETTSATFTAQNSNGTNFSLGDASLTVSASSGWALGSTTTSTTTVDQTLNHDALDGFSLQIKVYFAKYNIETQRRYSALPGDTPEWFPNGIAGTGTSLIQAHEWFKDNINE